jgi:hypothetical protein
MSNITYKYQSIGMMIQDNGMVAFQGYIMKITNGLAKRVALVENKGDGGSNIYHWAYLGEEAPFMQRAREVITEPEFLEIEDEFTELLFQESVGIYA